MILVKEIVMFKTSIEASLEPRFSGKNLKTQSKASLSWYKK